MNTQKMKMKLKTVFKNDNVFLMIFIFVLLIDVSMKLNPEMVVFRYFTKPIKSLLILAYFYFNTRNYKSKKNILIVTALISFLIADVIFINRNTHLYFSIGVLFMLFAKGCFIGCFLNKKDFNVFRLLPFLLFCFIYLSFILYAIFENLNGAYFMQVMLYYFVVLLLALFAFLRKGAVNVISYRLVFFGVLISFVSDGFTALNLFSKVFHLNAYISVLITFCYGASHYLIVSGLLKENHEDVILDNIKLTN